MDKQKSGKDQLFFCNQFLARSQMHLNKQNAGKLSNTNLDKNYYSLYEDSTLYLKPTGFSKTKRQLSKQTKTKHQSTKNLIIDESSPNKNLSRTRRCKSTRRNMLSCQQILDLAKKRQTYSAISMDHSSRPSCIKNTCKKQCVNKKSKKKKNWNNSSQIHLKNHINPSHFNSEKISNMNNAEIVVEYPMSQSNSYIVFSEKDSTLNQIKLSNIKNKKQQGMLHHPITIISKINMQKNYSFYTPEQNQGHEKRKVWAATIIQKNWRGYLTRKLLQQYIATQQLKVMKALEAYQNIEDTLRLNLGDELEKLEIAPIIFQQQKHGSSMKSMFKLLELSDKKDQVLNQGMVLDSECFSSQSSISRNGINGNAQKVNFQIQIPEDLCPFNKNNQSLESQQNSQSQSIQQSEQFCRKIPIMFEDTSQLVKSISQLQFDHEEVHPQSESDNQNQKLNEHQINSCSASNSQIDEFDDIKYYNDKQTGMTKMLIQIDQIMKPNDCNDSNKKIKSQSQNQIECQQYKEQQISKQIKQITEQIKLNQSPLKNIQSPSKNYNDPVFAIGENISWENLFTVLEESARASFQMQIKQAKEQLTNKLKSNQIDFIQMLKVRQSLNDFSEQLMQLLTETKNAMKKISNKIEQIFMHQNPKDKCHLNKKHPLQRKLLVKENYCQGIRQQFQQSENHSQHHSGNKSNKQEQNQQIHQNNGKFIAHFGQLTDSFDIHSSEGSNIYNTIKKNKIQGQFDEDLSHSHSPISEYYTIDLPTQQLTPYKTKSTSAGFQSLRMYIQNVYASYKNKINCVDSQQNISQTAYLCEILKKHSELGAENMIERCFIQLLVDILTGQHQLQDVILAVENWDGSYSAKSMKNCDEKQSNEDVLLELIKKWTKQLDKWELCPIEEVSLNMEESCEVSEKNTVIHSPQHPEAIQ